MARSKQVGDYFDWLYAIACKDLFPEGISYRKLLRELYDTEFIFLTPMDGNRAEDGMCLRRRYADDKNYPGVPYSIVKPCSVLEMMVALALRCEETIMSSPSVGDRTTQWFWDMIGSLGLGTMNDSRYDEKFVKEKIRIFLNREYEPDGKGGLFTIRNCDSDMRDVEIWIQLLWYLDTIT